jgi:hypothetical protein
MTKWKKVAPEEKQKLAERLRATLGKRKGTPRNACSAARAFF